MQSCKELMVAVYMITYNHEHYIETSIRSVLSQKTNFNFKLFIGEDCSSDKTKEICIKYKSLYPNKIDLICREKNIGVKKNAIETFNRCFQSSATYVALCEGDDYWTDPLKLQKQVDFLDNNPDYVLCFHKVKLLIQNGEIIDDYITTVPENYETIETLARLGNYIHTPSVVFKNIIKEFPHEFSLTPIGDYFLYMLLAEKGKLKYFEEVMGIYRYGVGIFSNLGKLKKARANLLLFTYLLSYFSDSTIKKIFLERHLISLSLYEKVKNNYKDNVKLSNIFYRISKKVLKYFKNQVSFVKNKL